MPIEHHAPELERIVSRDRDVEELASGFGGEMGPAEGPVWWTEGAICSSATLAIFGA